MKKAVLPLAYALENGGDEEALRRAVRLAALPLLTRALLGFGEAQVPRTMEGALPREVWRWLWTLRARPREAGRAKVSLAQDTAISFPWHPGRMLNAFLTVRRWRWDPGNHQAVLYLPLGVVHFQNGLHSGAIGVLARQGTLEAQVVDLAPALEAGLRVEWREDGVAEAVLPVPGWKEVREPFPVQEYAPLWEAARLLWERGVVLRPRGGPQPSRP